MITYAHFIHERFNHWICDSSAHEKDTRAKSVHLTAKGKSLTSKLVPIVEKIDEKFFGVVGKKDQQQLINLLDNLISKNE